MINITFPDNSVKQFEAGVTPLAIAESISSRLAQDILAAYVNGQEWDIYDKNKQLTGRTMIRNDWNMKEDEFHLTVLGIIKRSDGKYLITKRREDKGWGAGWWYTCPISAK